MHDDNLTLRKIQSKCSAKNIAITGITAAVYMVATWAIAPLSYGAVQFRFSELLVLLAFIDAGFAPGLILGCALANLFSPLGLIDLVFGTAGTFCTMVCITRTKSLFLASLWPTVFCIFVGFELWIIEGLPLFPTTFSVMFGEFIVVTVAGYPTFKTLLKNKKLIAFLKFSNRP